MLPEVECLLGAIERSGDNCKFYNNDNDLDLGEVLKSVSDGKLHKHELVCANGAVKELSF